MKDIKITASNLPAIEAALAQVNGKASEHTYTNAADIVRLAQRAENAVARLVGAKKHAPGAQMRALSGEAVSNSYNSKGYTRAATWVNIERKSSAWYLTRCERGDVGQGGGYERLMLTPAQDALAVAKFRKSYGVIA